MTGRLCVSQSVCHSVIVTFWEVTVNQAIFLLRVMRMLKIFVTFKSYGCQNHQLFRACGWTTTNSLDPSAEPPSKKPKRGLGRPRKVQSPTQTVIDKSDLPKSPLPATSTFRLAQAYNCALWKPSFILDWHLWWDRWSVRHNIGMCTRQIFPGLTQN